MNNFGDPKLPWELSRLQAVSKRENSDGEVEYLLDFWSKEFKVWAQKGSASHLQGHTIHLPRCPSGE